MKRYSPKRGGKAKGDDGFLPFAWKVKEEICMDLKRLFIYFSQNSVEKSMKLLFYNQTLKMCQQTHDYFKPSKMSLE